MTSPPHFTIRKASVHDATLVGSLLFEFNSEFGSPDPTAAELTSGFERLLPRNDVLVLLAEGTEAPLGFAYLTYRPTPYGDGPLAQLEELYVRPRLRDRGIGSALLVSALDDASERNAVEMDINVDEVDTDTRRFYERHGFSNIEAGADYRMLCYIREF